MVLLHYGLPVLVLLTGLAIYVEGRDCGAYQCDNGECIRASFKCDGGPPDCGDGSDESANTCGEWCQIVCNIINRYWGLEILPIGDLQQYFVETFQIAPRRLLGPSCLSLHAGIEKIPLTKEYSTE